MKMKAATICAVVCALALTLAATSYAQGTKVAGKWELTSEGRQGPMTRNMTIEQEGEKIKGVISGQRGDQEFTGTLKGKDISFTVKFQTPNGERTVEYKGTVDGDSMKGTVETPGGSREWTAKRAK
jgi:hypothetical protein